MQSSSTQSGAKPAIDIGAIVDDGGWTPLRKEVLALCSLAIVFDVLDNQILGFAIPSMLAEWQLAPADFAPALGLGTSVGGILGDRIGREAALILAVILFGLATAAISLADTVNEVSLNRFISGLGLGGALPAATTPIAEFTPSRRRCVAAGWAIGRFGSRIAILTMTGAAALTAAALMASPITVANQTGVMALLTVLGFFLLGAQGSLYALVRSTGLGAAAGVDRIGAVISAYVGAAMLGVRVAVILRGRRRLLVRRLARIGPDQPALRLGCKSSIAFVRLELRQC